MIIRSGEPKGDNNMTKWRRDLDQLATELNKIAYNLGNYAYELSNTKPSYEEIESIIFSACNHVERIADDLDYLHETRERTKLTETTTTTKTLYI